MIRSSQQWIEMRGGIRGGAQRWNTSDYLIVIVNTNL